MEGSFWSCSHCTFVNTFTVSECDACGLPSSVLSSKERDVIVNSDEQEEQPLYWSCTNCTLQNPTSLQACDACQTKRTQSKKIKKEPSMRTMIRKQSTC